MEWADKYVGIPYVDAGRNMEGCDCYGLVCIIFNNIFNIELPSFSKEYKKVDGEVTEIYKREIKNWKKVTVPKEGDVIYFRIAGEPMHVGIYLGGDEFIHTFKKGGSSTIGNITHGKWKNRVIGFWRYDKHSI